jgi:spore coat polysaccharide biosynthesis protein SpsF (cytidylyltransferase family)/aryl-alcohol dehydrogenase-like predicted oxidoreductase
MAKDKILIVLQARMSSKRLPFKSAASINSIPLAILCALRLSNKGHDLILATSNDPSDDYLVQLCKKYKIKFFRGNLKNVLKRFIECTSILTDETIIVRATADNPLNDGSIVNFAINQFNKYNLEYFTMPINSTNLPIGIGVEVFKLKKLREIYILKYDNYDREHVTWKLAKEFKAKKIYYNKIKLTKKSNYRATVDHLTDYFKILELFGRYRNIKKVSWKKLINIKSNFHYNYKTNNKKNIKHKIIMGGAQIGMNYGYKNEKIISDNQLKKIFNLMENKKINGIDTAQGYKLSEKKIGEQINNSKMKKDYYLFSKINQFDDILEITNTLIKTKIYINLYLSMFKLKTTYIDVLMIHSVNNFFKKKKIFKDIFLDLKRKNFVKDFGVSIYTPNELIKISKQNFFKFIQIPFNIIDNRWNTKTLLRLKKKYRFKLIARSIFLRGFLIHNKNWPSWFVEKNKLNKQIQNINKKFNLKNNLQLCIKYVNSISFIDYIVVGCNNSKQFKEILFAFEKRKFSKSEVCVINKTIKIKNKNILDARNF